jgi:hypothetical protein
MWSGGDDPTRVSGCGTAPLVTFALRCLSNETGYLGALLLPDLYECTLNWGPYLTTSKVSRTVRGPSSLGGVPENATIQSFEDPVVNSAFLAANLGAVTAIEQLASLAPGWDSYGADPIGPSAREAAVRFLAHIYGTGPFAPPIVGPGKGGRVVLQWFTPQYEVSAEVDEQGVSLDVAHLGQEEFLLERDYPAVKFVESARSIASYVRAR